MEKNAEKREKEKQLEEKRERKRKEKGIKNEEDESILKNLD